MPKSERKRKIKQWLSGRKMENGVSGQPETQQQNINPSGKCFQSIEKLPLYLFINCAVDKNIHSLVIEGEVEKEKLELAFADIQGQYSDMMGDTEYKHYTTIVKNLAIANCTIDQVEECIAALRLFPYQPGFEVLNKLLNYDFKLNYENKEEYYKQLDRAYRRSRGLVISRDLLQRQFEATKDKFKGDGNKEITRAYFIDWLIALSNHVQTTITDQITVYEFCKRVKDFNHYVERQQHGRNR